LITVIGRGAFGIVWLARDKNDPSRKEIAVKAVTAKDSSSFITAAFEAELLQILTAAMPASSRAHVPQYFTHSSIRSAGGGGTVRLAMSFVPGGALDKWLYGISDEEHKTVDVAQLVDGHLPGGQQGSWFLTNACCIVRHLLSQLAAVFAALQPIAFHRDVSSHNVLVDFPEGEQAMRPNFALIDFGLAVRSGSWMREWRNSNLAGDPRYWTPSAWMAFAFGFKYVATHPNSGFQQQYLQRMDHFSLGVLGLEALFALWNTGEAYEGKHPGLLEVRAAWCKYWVAVIHLFQMFHRQGAQEVRQFLAQSQDEGVTCLCNHLRQLRQSLRAAASHPLNSKCCALLRVIADLIDERGTVTWTEIPLMLGEDSAEAAAPSSPRNTSRSSIALTDSQPSSAAQRIEHRRIRSTGGTVDQELRRFEPEISTALYQSLQTQHTPQWASAQSGASNNFSPDLLSRSFTHARPLSGYM
jgi:serine/threonine protein kinase